MPSLDAIKSFAADRFALEPGKARLASMEGLRGFSALIVFFVHFNAIFGSRAEHAPIQAVSLFLASMGHCGVDIFFALSGFLMYGMLLKRPYGYVHFVQRRIQRLYPTFLVILTLYVLLGLVAPGYSRFPASRSRAVLYLAANILMLPGIFPIVPIITVAWSLSYELVFYLTLPLLIQWLKIFKWQRAARTGFFLILSIAHFWMCMAGISQHTQLIMFGCGILIRETCDLRPRVPWFGDLAALALLVAALTLTGIVGQPQFASISGQVLQRSGFAYALLFLAVYAVGCCAFGENGLLSRWFSADWIRWMGNMSYSYYLAHGAILHLLRIFLDFLHLPAFLSSLQFAMLGLLSLIVTVAGSAIVFLFVEKPLSFPTRRVAGYDLRPAAPVASAVDVQS